MRLLERRGVGKPTHPGYPAIGRMKGPAEAWGVIRAVSSLNGLPH